MSHPPHFIALPSGRFENLALVLNVEPQPDATVKLTYLGGGASYYGGDDAAALLKMLRGLGTHELRFEVK